MAISVLERVRISVENIFVFLSIYFHSLNVLRINTPKTLVAVDRFNRLLNRRNQTLNGWTKTIIRLSNGLEMLRIPVKLQQPHTSVLCAMHVSLVFVILVFVHSFVRFARAFCLPFEWEKLLNSFVYSKVMW